MADAYMESRVRIELETLSFVIGMDEAQELYEKLEDILPREDVVRNHGGSFGFGRQNEEESNDE